MAVLEVAFPSSCVDVPHANSAAFVAADDLRHIRQDHALQRQLLLLQLL